MCTWVVDSNCNLLSFMLYVSTMLHILSNMFVVVVYTTVWLSLLVYQHTLILIFHCVIIRAFSYQIN